jgi:hypothetical protein
MHQNIVREEKARNNKMGKRKGERERERGEGRRGYVCSGIGR